MEEKIELFDKLQKDIHWIDCNKAIVMGDLIGRIGKDNQGMEKWKDKEDEKSKKQQWTKHFRVLYIK